MYSIDGIYIIFQYSFSSSLSLMMEISAGGFDRMIDNHQETLSLAVQHISFPSSFWLHEVPVTDRKT